MPSFWSFYYDLEEQVASEQKCVSKLRVFPQNVELMGLNALNNVPMSGNSTGDAQYGEQASTVENVNVKFLLFSSTYQLRRLLPESRAVDKQEMFAANNPLHFRKIR